MQNINGSESPKSPSTPPSTPFATSSTRSQLLPNIHSVPALAWEQPDQSTEISNSSNQWHSHLADMVSKLRDLLRVLEDTTKFSNQIIVLQQNFLQNEVSPFCQQQSLNSPLKSRIADMVLVLEQQVLGLKQTNASSIKNINTCQNTVGIQGLHNLSNELLCHNDHPQSRIADIILLLGQQVLNLGHMVASSVHGIDLQHNTLESMISLCEGALERNRLLCFISEQSIYVG